MPRVGRRVGAYFSDLAWCSRSVIRGGYGGERGAQYDGPSRRVAPAPVHAWTGYRGVGRATFYAATSRPPADWSAGGRDAVLTRAEAFRTRWRRVPSPANQGDVRLVRGGDEQRPVGDFAPLARILVRF